MRKIRTATGAPQPRFSVSLKPLEPKIKLSRYWFQGQLITKSEHDKLSLAEILASNNQYGNIWK